MKMETFATTDHVFGNEVGGDTQDGFENVVDLAWGG
jgi:hypothetical protein